MNQKRPFKLFRTHWPLVVGTAIVGLLVALVTSLTTPTQWEAQTQFFVSTSDSNSTSALSLSNQFSQQRVLSYAQLFEDDNLLAAVGAKVHPPLEGQSLKGAIDGAAVSDTVLINVTTTAHDPAQAVAVAAALDQVFPAYVENLESTSGSASSPVKVSVTELPEFPQKPTSPKTLQNIILGLVAGALIGSILAGLRIRFDRKVRDVEGLQALSSIPLLGILADAQSRHARRRVNGSLDSFFAESSRAIALSLGFLDPDAPPKVFIFTSSGASEGKTTTVLSVARALASLEQRVLIVDADLRRPRIASNLNLIEEPGLAEVLTGHMNFDDAVQSVSSLLSVLPAGRTPPNPSSLLASRQLSDLIEAARDKFEFILLDSAPILPVADTSALASQADGTIVCVREGRTTLDDIDGTLAALASVDARVFGFLLTFARLSKSELGYGYGYGYGYGHVADNRNGEATPEPTGENSAVK